MVPPYGKTLKQMRAFASGHWIDRFIIRRERQLIFSCKVRSIGCQCPDPNLLLCSGQQIGDRRLSAVRPGMKLMHQSRQIADDLRLVFEVENGDAP